MLTYSLLVVYSLKITILTRITVFVGAQSPAMIDPSIGIARKPRQLEINAERI